MSACSHFCNVVVFDVGDALCKPARIILAVIRSQLCGYNVLNRYLPRIKLFAVELNIFGDARRQAATARAVF